MNVLTQQHRAQQLLVRHDTMTKMARLWPALDYARLDATFPGFAVAAARLVQANRQTSAGLTSAYLRRFSKAAGIPGDVRLGRLEPFNVDQFATSLHVVSVASIKSATAESVAADVAMTNGLTRTQMAMARLALEGGRQILTATVQADPGFVGYQRVLGGGGCDFCKMLAGRGAVYGEQSVNFEAHDKCGCTGEPVPA